MKIENWTKISNDYWRSSNDYVSIIEVDSPTPHRNLYVAKTRRGQISKRPESLTNALATARYYMKNHP